MSVQEHFSARASRYDASSHWCTDPALVRKVLMHLAPRSSDRVLDVACGTGLVSRGLREHVATIVGIDLTPEMAEQARPHLDALVMGPAEALPFADGEFDIAVCRQGIQFMDAPRAVAEMVRVVKASGKVCLIHLCAYGDTDAATYFEILRLRNPARPNFYRRGDLEGLLRAAGCGAVAVHEHVSSENVDVWSDNGAIDEAARMAIRAAYRGAPAAFGELHAVEIGDGQIVDNMLFEIAIGTK